MKHLTILILNFILVAHAQGQTLTEKIALKTCEYLDSITNYQQLQDSIQPSIIAAMTQVIIEGTLEETKILSTGNGIIETTNVVYEILPTYCYSVRRMILEDKTSRFYKNSEIPKANEHFEKGNSFMENGDFKSAIKEFESALKHDKKFVFAIDHLAVSYRRLENYKEAVKHYKKSLDIFPEGEVALLNIAVVYYLLKDDENSIANYEYLKFLYPINPEGYFGLAKMLFMKGDYENAFDNLFIAHRIYVETNSAYVKDSELLMSIMITQMKELDKMDLVERKAKEYNVTIKE